LKIIRSGKGRRGRKVGRCFGKSKLLGRSSDENK